MIRCRFQGMYWCALKPSFNWVLAKAIKSLFHILAEIEAKPVQWNCLPLLLNKYETAPNIFNETKTWHQIVCWFSWIYLFLPVLAWADDKICFVLICRQILWSAHTRTWSCPIFIKLYRGSPLSTILGPGKNCTSGYY